MIPLEAWLRSVGRTIRIIVLVVVVLVAGLVVALHRPPPGPAPCPMTQRCGPCGDYCLGQKRQP